MEGVSTFAKGGREGGSVIILIFFPFTCEYFSFRFSFRVFFCSICFIILVFVLYIFNREKLPGGSI